MSQHERLVAIHEAGHALAHIRLGILQSKATIVPGDQSAGSVLAEDSAVTEEAAADQIIALCAGYGALQIFGHGDEDSRAGAGSDFEKAEELIDFSTWEIWKSGCKRQLNSSPLPKTRRRSRCLPTT